MIQLKFTIYNSTSSWLYTPDSIYVNKTKGTIKNGSRDTLGTQNTGQSQRQTKQKTQH